MRTFKPLLFTAALASALFISGCEEETDPIDTLEVPSTYAFTRDGISTVDHAGQTERLDQLAIMTTLMKTGNTLGNAAINGQLLKDMFANTGNPYVGLTFTKDLRSKCFSADVAQLEAWMDEVSANSAVQQTASEGNAGVLVEGNTDPTVGYLVNANGIQMAEVIEKGLMGAVFYFQAMEIYLSEERMAELGNDDFVDGENYTAMEHYFDEAFGYLGAPVDFPSATSIDQARYWGKYTQARNNGLYPGISEEMATAFRTGRAAITSKDYEVRDEAIHTIQEKWAIVAAASAVDYLTKALSTSAQPIYKNHHVLSEAIGFCIALKYHFNGGNSKFPPVYDYTKIEEALDIIGTTTNLYQVNDADINAAIVKIKEAFPAGVIK